jgi:DNA-binding transcriptional regulator YhcF (GntR family)
LSTIPEPTQRSPRREQVVEALREAIIAGKLEDGERLIEDKIARELKTSRGPVREALKQLEHEGFVVSYPYRGAVVLGVSDEEVHQVLIPVRLTLEKYSIPKAVERMDDADFAELAKEVWVMGEAARTNDLQKSVDADMRFHELMLERLALQVEERHLDARDRVCGDALPVPRVLLHAVYEPLDPERVLPDEELRELALDDGLDRRERRPGRLADPDQALVGVELDDQPRCGLPDASRPLQRLAERDADCRSVHACNPQGGV